MIYRCCQQNRRNAVAEHPTLNGIDYLEVLDPNAARGIANTMSTHSEDAVRRCLDAIEELGCEELYLVPATADLSEIDRVAELLAKR